MAVVKVIEILRYSIPKEIPLPVIRCKEPFYVTNSRRRKGKKNRAIRPFKGR